MSETDILSTFFTAGLKPGINWQRDLSELVKEIAIREKISYKQVIEDFRIKEIFEAKKLSSPQKLKKIKDILFCRRYPALSLARANLNSQIKDLKLCSEIKVRFDPYFENEDIKIELNLNSKTDINDVIDSLNKIYGAGLIDNALKFAEDNC